MKLYIPKYSNQPNVLRVIMKNPYMEGVKFLFGRSNRNLSTYFETCPLNSLHQTESIDK